MANHKLAIVIPAYKVNYLDHTLESIANQACKDFTLYIGDDASPYDIKGIVEKYRSRIDIVYKRFDDNKGGSDLVAQWERCIAMTQNEPWIWLFSDDDMMDSNCVESFYETKSLYPSGDLYRFDVNVINRDGRILRKILLPEEITAEYLFKRKSQGKIESFAVEYIFSRKIYDECDGFQNFDLAWGSDTATWIKFGYQNGIKTIKSSYVSWRSSGYNITTNGDDAILYRKLNASIDYLNWAFSFWRRKGKDYDSFIDRQSLKRILGSVGVLSYSKCYNALCLYKNCGLSMKLTLILQYPLYYIYRKIRQIII